MYKEIRKILSSSCLSEDDNGCKYDGNCYEHENAKIEELIAKHDAKLLDKFVARLKDYFVIPHDVSVIERMANELKAEVRENV